MHAEYCFRGYIPWGWYFFFARKVSHANKIKRCQMGVLFTHILIPLFLFIRRTPRQRGIRAANFESVGMVHFSAPLINSRANDYTHLGIPINGLSRHKSSRPHRQALIHLYIKPGRCGLFHGSIDSYPQMAVRSLSGH